MKAVLIDSDICLDVFLYRAPFFKASTKVLERLEKELLKGVVSVVAFSNIFYLLRKNEGQNKALNHLKMLRRITTVGVINSNAFDQALESNWNDFEDALQYFCAIEEGCEAIITRNVTDYQKSSLQVSTPAQFLEAEEM